MSGPAGKNVVDSVRIELLLNALDKCKKTMAPSDPALQAAEDAAAKLDPVDKEFLKDPKQSAPFWQELEAKLPPAELTKITQRIKR
jgi:hypothetical protein